MNKLLVVILITCWLPVAKAAVGVSYGLGLPYTTQLGLNYTMGNSLTIHAGQNSLSISSGLASVDLSMPEASILWHPFQGSLFLGVGLGSQTFKSSATDILTSQTASVEISATTTLVKFGWMWGKADGGLWFGIDFTTVIPSTSDIEITAPGLSTSDKAYKDVESAVKQFANSSYTNTTIARVGYLF